MGVLVLFAVLLVAVPVTAQPEVDPPSGGVATEVECGPPVLALFHATDASARHPALCGSAANDRLGYELIPLIGIAVWLLFFYAVRRRLRNRGNWPRHPFIP